MALIEEAGLLGDMAGSTVGQEKYGTSLGPLTVAENKEMLRRGWSYPAKTQGPTGSTPNGQIQGNLSKKINNDSNGLQCTE